MVNHKDKVFPLPKHLADKVHSNLTSPLVTIGLGGRHRPYLNPSAHRYALNNSVSIFCNDKYHNFHNSSPVFVISENTFSVNNFQCKTSFLVTQKHSVYRHFSNSWSDHRKILKQNMNSCFVLSIHEIHLLFLKKIQKQLILQYKSS